MWKLSGEVYREEVYCLPSPRSKHRDILCSPESGHEAWKVKSTWIMRKERSRSCMLRLQGPQRSCNFTTTSRRAHGLHPCPAVSARKRQSHPSSWPGHIRSKVSSFDHHLPGRSRRLLEPSPFRPSGEQTSDLETCRAQSDLRFQCPSRKDSASPSDLPQCRRGPSVSEERESFEDPARSRSSCRTRSGSLLVVSGLASSARRSRSRD